MAINYEAYRLDPFEGVNRGLMNIGQALQYQQQLKRQKMIDAENTKLKDLQIGELEREKDYQIERERRLSNLMPGERYEDVAAELALRKGKFDEAGKILNFRDINAQIQAKGDLPTYYNNLKKIENMETFAKTIKPFVNRPELLKKLWPTISGSFPDVAGRVDPTTLAETPEGIVMNARNEDGSPNFDVQYMYDNKRNIKIIKREKTHPEFKKIRALEKIADIDYKLATVDEELSLPDEKSRLEYIASLQKQRDALLPYTGQEVPKNRTSEPTKRTEVERRTIDGRTLVKYSDGSIGELK